MQESQPAANSADIDKIGKAKDVLTNLSAELTRMKAPLDETLQKMYEITMAADSLNKTFIGNRARIREMMESVSDVTPEIVSLGGEFKDVGKTIEGIALGSRRNLIATKEDITELFATSEIIGQDVNKLVDQFAKVGVMYSDISEQVLDSINYANSIGVNAKAVMGEVLANTEQLSRFNFEGGVQGLTKMAAQASMLRFDMKQTFELADKVLDPDKAIEVASAFQRLGVSAGNLTDPFMLMNQSINDPSGLQDSLINVAKQFTYFDEKTKSFKISPQGILTLREMEAQTGVSAKSMREAALSAADFDKRMTDIKKTGIATGFSEDDQKLIANLSRMNEKGTGYEIKVVDEQGKESYKKLTDLSSEQLKATVEAEKTRPKDIEAVQRNQLNIQEGMLANLKEINEKILRGITGNQTALNNISKFSGAAREKGRNVASKYFNEDYMKTVEKYQKDLAAAGTDEKKRKEILEKIEKEISTTGGSVLSAFKDAGQDIGKGSLPFSKQIDSIFKLFDADKIGSKKTSPELGSVLSSSTGSPTASPIVNNDFIFGRNKAAQNATSGTASTVGGGGNSVNQTIEVKPISGKIDINVNATGADSKSIEDILSKGSVTLKERIFEIVTEQSKITPGRIK
jgi:hypothetical protein